jgi:hypothetical protein
VGDKFKQAGRRDSWFYESDASQDESDSNLKTTFKKRTAQGVTTLENLERNDDIQLNGINDHKIGTPKSVVSLDYDPKIRTTVKNLVTHKDNSWKFSNERLRHEFLKPPGLKADKASLMLPPIDQTPISTLVKNGRYKGKTAASDRTCSKRVSRKKSPRKAIKAYRNNINSEESIFSGDGSLRLEPGNDEAILLILPLTINESIMETNNETKEPDSKFLSNGVKNRKDSKQKRLYGNNPMPDLTPRYLEWLDQPENDPFSRVNWQGMVFNYCGARNSVCGQERVRYGRGVQGWRECRSVGSGLGQPISFCE